jgi:Villin headpiece domain
MFPVHHGPLPTTFTAKAVAETQPKLPYAELRSRCSAGVLGGLAARCLHVHLDEAEFRRVFECPPTEFAALPSWKQDQFLKKAKLFVPAN